MVQTHILGFPRMGAQRELKFALESHWAGTTSAAELETLGTHLRARHWALQQAAGLDYVTVGDFAYYDHVANHIQLLGCEPVRFGFENSETELAVISRWRVAYTPTPTQGAMPVAAVAQQRRRTASPRWR